MAGPLSPALNAFIQSDPILASVWNADQATLSADQLPTTNLKNQIASFQSQETTWQTLNSTFLNVYNDTQNVLGSSLWTQTTATSSNTAVVTASGTSAPVGVYNVLVNNLAQAEIDNGTAQGTGQLGLTGSFTINGQTINVASTDTLQNIVNNINANTSDGVTATILAGTTMELTGNTLGPPITFTDPNGILQSLGVYNDSTSTVSDQIQKPQYGNISVNGVSIPNLTSNTVTTAVNGLTLNLIAPSTGGIATPVTVTANTSGVVSSIQTLVNDYNTAVEAANAQISAQNPITDAEMLSGTLQQMSSTVSSTVTNGVTLQDVGITFNSSALQSTSMSNQSGTLSFNSAALTQELQTNPTGAQAELQAFATQLGNQLNYLTSPISGTIEGASGSINQQLMSQVTSLQSELTFSQQNAQMQQNALLSELGNLAEALMKMQMASQSLGLNSSSSTSVI